MRRQSKYVSLINLASLRDFEHKIGRPVEPIRFRANVYFDGLPAWKEQGWMEQKISVGGAKLRVIAPIYAVLPRPRSIQRPRSATFRS